MADDPYMAAAEAWARTYWRRSAHGEAETKKLIAADIRTMVKSPELRTAVDAASKPLREEIAELKRQLQSAWTRELTE